MNVAREFIKYSTITLQGSIVDLLTTPRKKILVVAAIAFGFLAIGYLAKHYFQAKVDPSPQSNLIHPLNSILDTKKVDAALEEIAICPITQEPFKEPYFCLEDGFTYEKDAIIKWIQIEVKKKMDRGLFHLTTIKSPASGVDLNCFTLCPNKILFKSGGIPQDQSPLVFDIQAMVPKPVPVPIKQSKYVHDSAIRDMILTYPKNSDDGYYLKRDLLDKKIDDLRFDLGLGVTKEVPNQYPRQGPDFSHLDLSHLTFDGLQSKGGIFIETNFSKCTFKNCDFARSHFLSCNLQEATFIDCNFQGEEVSFVGSDMHKAQFISKRYHLLEKGKTWNKMRNWAEFKDELKKRGALGVDSIICV